ncbi:MAG: threonine synthase [Acidobacteriota bacterium]
MRINPNIRRLACSLSGKDVDPRGFATPVGLCRCCPPPGKPVVVEYDLHRVHDELRREAGQALPGLWRHAALLPVIEVPGDYAPDVGGTPSVHHAALGDELGLDLFVKNEGGNPSGSFKDRGLAVGVALGAASGARRFCLPTQGNAGVAACLFSRRLGLPACVVYMPEAWRGSIYHRSCTHFGGEVRFAGANIAAAGKAMRADLAGELTRGEAVDLSTFFEPGRLEGKKTMGLEIVAELGGAALPEYIVYPTGGGTGLVGIWKAFRELAAMGMLGVAGSPLPRLVAVQSERCAPVVRSFERGLSEVEPVVSQGTIADGLDVPGAIMGHAILAAVRESGGTAVAVSDSAIADAFARCGMLGIATSFEGAATLAAVRAMRAGGQLAPGARVLLLLTASQLIPLSRPAA